MAFPQVTPMRPVPGAFINTPAMPRGSVSSAADPVRRRLFPEPDPTGARGQGNIPISFSANPTTAAPVPAGGVGGVVSGSRSQLPPTDPSSPIVKAARAINSVLQTDESYPDLDSYCRQGASSEYDLSYLESSWTPFHRTQMYPIPNQVFEQYNAGQLQTLMGLFAEINHAWVVIDNSIFLWDYTQPDPQLIGFEDQPHTIHAVALVAPKPGIFVDAITHILVLATSSEMILLGVSAESTPAGTRSVSLFVTKMVLPIRGSDVRIITGSSSGRIFFGGNSDTDINELYYQREERWFSNRCGRINHTNPGWATVVALQSGIWGAKNPEHLVDIVIDDSRNLLYTLSSKSTIRTYHLEAPNRLTKVIEKEKNHCLRDITHMINVSSLLNDRMRIVSISTISSREASKLHLMALTNTGCRLFLSATNAASYTIGGTASSLAPQSMQVQFIKFPPSGSKKTSTGLSTSGDSVVDLESKSLQTSRHGLRFAPGYFLDFVSKETHPNEDLLFVSAPEPGRIKFTPSASALKYYEHGIWIELGSRAEAVGLVTKPFAAAKQPLGFGNELAVQFDDPPSEFAILTNTGVHILRRRRLVDMFAAALRGAVGDEGLEQETRKFIQQYGRVETISSALAVACGHGSDTRPGAPRALDQTTEDRARAVFVDYGGQPTIAETDGTPLTTDSVRLSSRHDALALYLARLTRMLWKSTVVLVTHSATSGPIVNTAIPIAKLNYVQENLERLRRFLDANRAFIQGLSGPSDLQRVSSKQEEIALQAEHQALHALEKLMESISEGISFVLMLFDERVSDIFNRLEEPARQRLKTLTYEKLFSRSSGRDLAKLLVKAIVNRNIESGSNVETVADALRRRCGSFCSPDDVVIFRAQEQLKRASEQQPNANQSRATLHESLRLFQRVAGSLSFDNLQLAVTQYIDQRYYAGGIQLCLAVAREKDRGNTALAWMSDGKPENDPRAEVFAERKRCYDLIHTILVQLDADSRKEPEMVDGQPTLTSTKRAEAYDVVNGSEDEVFHFDLYDWYIKQGWTDRILAVESPHVITFLEQLAQTDARHAELLCSFHTHRSQFFEAATVQYNLAQSGFPIGIKDRITLLSRAKANANVASPGAGRQQRQYLDHAITELLAVAHIQDDLLERLRADDRITPERTAEIETILDGQIQSLTDLFNNYADQAGYYDLCLLIYHAADYRQPATIAGTWANLIQQAHDEVVARMQAGAKAVPGTPLPYESVSVKIQEIAHRTSCDTIIFPVNVLLPEVCQYAVANQQDAHIGADPAWPVQLFLSVGISHDLITRILENVYDTQDYGFAGVARTRLIELIMFVVDAWVKDVRRRGAGPSRGSNMIGAGVRELLERCEADLPAPGHGQNTGGADLNEVRRQLRQVRRDMDSLAERMATGSVRFA